MNRLKSCKHNEKSSDHANKPSRDAPKTTSK